MTTISAQPQASDSGSKPSRKQRAWTAPEVRFVRFIQEDSDTGCWLWTGSIRSNGYGGFGVRTPSGSYSHLPSHRFAYMHWVGQIPDGYEIDHLCRVRNCVNPEHLEAVTPQENVRRSLSPAAVNAAKTHCLRGHPFDETNTGRQARGRFCRECKRQLRRAYRATPEFRARRNAALAEQRRAKCLAFSEPLRVATER